MPALAMQDLLRPESENLQIREAEGGGVFISGVQQVEVASIEQCLHLLQLGDRNRWVWGLHAGGAGVLPVLVAVALLMLV